MFQVTRRLELTSNHCLCCRFDCGSGLGVVRSEETVLLNQWNRLTLYRHRWDAWIQLNNGRHVEGRSKVSSFIRVFFLTRLNLSLSSLKISVVPVKPCLHHARASQVQGMSAQTFHASLVSSGVCHDISFRSLPVCKLFSRLMLYNVCN
jgi:hypothetical protein